MKKTATLAIALLSSGIAFADQPGADWMPAEQVIQKVKEAGYSSISKIEADDGRWEGEGLKSGKKMKFHADPKTGVLTSERAD